MFSSPETMFLRATEHRQRLIAEADRQRLLSAARKHRRAARAARAAAAREGGGRAAARRAARDPETGTLAACGSPAGA